MKETNKAILKKAERELKKLDPKLGRLIARQKLILREPRIDYFSSLCRSIIGQQVSVRSAEAIALRFETRTEMKPVRVMKLSLSDIKFIGLSRQKASYLNDLAKHFNDNPHVYEHLERQNDEEVIAELTAVRGIGVWTAQMFLMFTLRRQDVFAPDDSGLQRAMQLLYGWKTIPKRKELEKFAEKWKPYRTVACLHLWQSLHNTP